MNCNRRVLVLLIILCCFCPILNAQNSSEKSAAKTAEEVVTTIYNLVSFKPGETPDWEKVKSVFVEDALVVLRASRTHHNIFSREGFIDDFKNFISRSNVNKTGFLEKIINKKTTIFGDVAHCFVVYEASIPGLQRPPQKGIDSFQLMKKDGQWRIVSIVNEIVTPNNPIPKELLK